MKAVWAATAPSAPAVITSGQVPAPRSRQSAKQAHHQEQQAGGGHRHRHRVLLAPGGLSRLYLCGDGLDEIVVARFGLSAAHLEREQSARPHTLLDDRSCIIQLSAVLGDEHEAVHGGVLVQGSETSGHVGEYLCERKRGGEGDVCGDVAVPDGDGGQPGHPAAGTRKGHDVLL